MIRVASLLALIVSLALSGLLWAEQAPSGDAPKEKKQTHQVTGKVVSVADDQTSVVLAVRRGGDEQKQVTIQLTAETKYTLNGKAAKMQEVLKVGQKVHVVTNDAQPPVALKVKAIDEEKEKQEKERKKQEKEQAKKDQAPAAPSTEKKE